MEPRIETRERLRNLKWGLLGLTAIALALEEAYYLLVRKVPLSDDIFDWLLGMTIALVLIEISFRIVYRLQDQAVQQAEQLAVVNAVAQTVSQSLDLDTLLSAALDKVLETLEFESGAIYVKGIETGELEMKQHRGLSEEFRRGVAKGIISARVADSGKPIVIDDLSQDPNTPRVVAEEGYKSLASIPLLSKEQVQGVLTVSSRQLRHFRQQDVDLLLPIGNQIGVAIENARLYDKTQRRLQELETLHQVSASIVSTLELDKTLQLIMDSAVKAVPSAQKGSLHLLDEERNELVMRAGCGFSREVMKAATFKVGEGYTGWAFAHNRPVIIDNVKADLRTKPIDLPEVHEEKAAICVPLAVKGRTIGTLTLDNITSHGAFDENDLQLLSAFANQAAIAIENARLYEKELRRVTQLRAIHQVSRQAASILDLDQLLHEAVNSIRDTFGYYRTHVLLVDAEREEIVLKAAASASGKPLEEWRARLSEESINGWVAGTGQPLLVNDVAQEPRYRLVGELKDTKSELAVPIKIKDTVIGTLDVQSTELNAFDESDIATLQTLADQLAVAMENARLYEETKRLAITDGLTGLYNLRYFYETLEKEIQRSERYHRSLSLIILDIDEFKAYNDLYGHLAGDDLLIEFAQLMSKVARRTDILARYGGEEFAIILPETETGGARFLAERLLEAVREHRFSIQDGQTIGQITISVGAATYSHHADSAKALVDAADKALLRAKRAGKNRISVYEEELTEPVAR